MKKDTKILLGLTFIVILIIGGIFVYKNLNKENTSAESMKCIASKTKLYSLKTCTHCQNQKATLGEYYNLFDVTDCFYEGEKCKVANIPGYPTWIINGTMNPGEKSIKELKELTGC